MSITNDGATVINVIAGPAALCCSDSARIEQIRSTALERLACVTAEASAIVQVADQTWDYDRFLKAMQSLISWCDQQIDQLTPLGYIVSSGPECPY